jgi:hypothetical protein
MNRSEITYGQLDQVLRSLGFTCRPGIRQPPGRIYEHEATGAVIKLPAVADCDQVYEYHLLTARKELEHFGIADPSTFAAKLQKAG